MTAWVFEPIQKGKINQIQNKNLFHWSQITTQSMAEDNAANWLWRHCSLSSQLTGSQTSWGQQGGHLSLVRAKLGSVSSTRSMSLLNTIGTAGESHTLYIEVYASVPGLCLSSVDLLGLPYQSAANKVLNHTDVQSHSSQRWKSGMRAPPAGQVPSNSCKE